MNERGENGWEGQAMAMYGIHMVASLQMQTRISSRNND